VSARRIGLISHSVHSASDGFKQWRLLTLSEHGSNERSTVPSEQSPKYSAMFRAPVALEPKNRAYQSWVNGSDASSPLAGSLSLRNVHSKMAHGVRLISVPWDVAL